MAEQVRVEKPKQTKSTEAELAQLAEDGAAVQAAQDTAVADTSESDALLDEIDALLEENAEEFVKNYRQLGGQ